MEHEVRARSFILKSYFAMVKFPWHELRILLLGVLDYRYMHNEIPRLREHTGGGAGPETQR